MNLSYEIYPVDSVLGALEKAIEISDDWRTKYGSTDVWFRGICDSSFRLLPGAYWRNNYSESDPYMDFKNNYLAYSHTVTELDDWDVYFLAQHHGIPTRLLDWTENCLASVYFATSNWNGETTPSIWVMDPSKFNELSIGWRGLIVPMNREKDSLWLPLMKKHQLTFTDDEGFKYNNKNPLAIWPKRSNNRIVAQQGTFTVHGVDKKSIDELIIDEADDPTSTLARVDLINLDPVTVKKQLVALGMKHSSIYPDTDNYVKDLKELYKW